MKVKKSIKTDKLSFEYFITVNKEGLFTTILPKEIIEKLKAVGIELGISSRHRIGAILQAIL